MESHKETWKYTIQLKLRNCWTNWLWVSDFLHPDQSSARPRAAVERTIVPRSCKRQRWRRGIWRRDAPGNRTFASARLHTTGTCICLLCLSPVELRHSTKSVPSLSIFCYLFTASTTSSPSYSFLSWILFLMYFVSSFIYMPVGFHWNDLFSHCINRFSQCVSCLLAASFSYLMIHRNLCTSIFFLIVYFGTNLV